MATTTTTTVCGVRARPLAPPPVQVPPLPTTVGPLVPMQYVPPPGVPLVTPTNAGGARPLTTAQALAQKLMAPPSKQPRGQQPRGQARRWTDEEHEEFLAAVGRFGKRWKTVAEHVPSKTAAQVRTHATKYFSKLKERQDLSDPAAMLLQLAAASPAKCAA